MQQQIIVDEDGAWFTNTAQFAFTDPTSKVRFAPGVRVKVKASPWLQAQTTIVAEPVAAPVAAPAPAPAPAAAPVKAQAPAAVAKPAKA